MLLENKYSTCGRMWLAKRYGKCALLLSLFLAFVPARAQKIDVSANVSFDAVLWERFAVGAALSPHQMFGKYEYFWWQAKGRVGFIFVGDTYLHASFVLARANNDFDERMLSFAPGIGFGMNSRIKQTLTAELRQMRYGEHKVNNSRLVYDVAASWSFGERKLWAIAPMASFVFNIESDVDDSDWLQRVRLRCELSRKLGESASAVLFYGFRFGGSNQRYMGDYSNMNEVGIALNFFRSGRKQGD